MEEFHYQIPTIKEGYRLRDYQNHAQQWMESVETEDNGGVLTSVSQQRHGIRGGILVMEMGLGKTLIALHHIFSMQSKKNEKFPTLIVTSKTVMYEWMYEGIKKFYPNARVCYFHREVMGKTIYESITSEQLRSHSIVFTTYDVISLIYRKLNLDETVCVKGNEFSRYRGKVIEVKLRDRPNYNSTLVSDRALANMPWQRMITDESQRFANYKTTTYKSVMAIYANWRFCLSGTPIRNYDTDIWSLFRFCGFTAIDNARHWRGSSSYNVYNLSRFVYLKNYQDVGVVIPSKKEIIYEIEMTEKQVRLYVAYLREIIDMLELAKNTVNLMAVLAVFTRLRQVCIAPHIIVKPKKKGNVINDITLKNSYAVTSSAGEWIRDVKGDAGFESPKVKKIIEVIRDIPKDEKVLVFSMFSSCLQIVEEAVIEKLPSLKTSYLDGSINGKDRMEIIENFRYNPEIKAMFVHYKIGGEGLNLTVANHVICIEPWWTHAVHNQGIARVWRCNQTKEVVVHWILARNSIEREILKMCINKKYMSDEYLYGIARDKKKVTLGRSDLMRLAVSSLRAHALS